MAWGAQIALMKLGDRVFGKVARDVGLADDAHQAVILDNGHSADLMCLHDGQYLFDAGAGADVIGPALGQSSEVNADGRDSTCRKLFPRFAGCDADAAMQAFQPRCW